MRGLGVHVCEYCGRVWDTPGLYLKCAESHESEPNYAEWLVAVLQDRAENP